MNDDERQARIAQIRSDLARPWQEVERAVETARWLLAELDAATARAERAEAFDGLLDSPTGPYVLAFARRMEAKLDRNRHKGDRHGWLGMHPLDLLRRARDEADELENAILSGHVPDAVWAEAADAANFALMVADSYRHRAALDEGRDDGE